MATPALADVYVTPDASKPITTKEELFSHLYDAAKVEMQTIPMYLYAGYSIKTQNVSQWSPGPGAFRLIKTVVTEEMLHLSLVRNLIVAIGYGDHIRFCDQNFVPSYPATMLHRKPPLELKLAQLTPNLVKNVFMEFEKPAKKGAPPQSEEYDTLGQFYKAIYAGFMRLAGIQHLDIDRFFDSTDPSTETLNYPSVAIQELFKNNEPYKQYVETYWNEGGGGEPILVRDLTSALTAINTIVEQGEGMDADSQKVPTHPEKPRPGLFEYPHYVKFDRIARGWEPIGDVHPVPENPKASKFPTGSVQDLGLLCNAAYTYVLRLLDEIYNTTWSDVKPGEVSERYGLERNFIAAMQGLLFGIVNELVQTPITTGKYKDRNAAPPFDFYSFPANVPMTDHMKELCDKVIPYYPRLGGDNSVRWLLDKMPSLYP